MKKNLLLLLVSLLLTACAALQPAAPEINLMGLVMDDVTLSHVNMVANLRLFNPNDMTINVESVEYALELNGVQVSTGKALRRLSIPANDYGTLDLRLSSSYLDLYRFFSRVQQGEELDFRLAGKVRVGGLAIIGHTFDFDHKGKIPLLSRKEDLPPLPGPPEPPPTGH
jgi:LEA14-like dessication related protein